MLAPPSQQLGQPLQGPAVQSGVTVDVGQESSQLFGPHLSSVFLQESVMLAHLSAHGPVPQLKTVFWQACSPEQENAHA